MKASEVIAALQALMAEHGDLTVSYFDDGYCDAPVSQIDHAQHWLYGQCVHTKNDIYLFRIS